MSRPEGYSRHFRAKVQGLEKDVTFTVYATEGGTVRLSFIIPGFPISPVVIVPAHVAADIGKLTEAAALDAAGVQEEGVL